MLIDRERGRRALNELVEDDDDLAIAAVSAAELFLGVELADDAHRARRLSSVVGIVQGLRVEVYDLDVARAHAKLLAHVRRAGRARGAHDLMIAATAAAREREVVTIDRRGFHDLPGVLVRTPR